MARKIRITTLVLFFILLSFNIAYAQTGSGFIPIEINTELFSNIIDADGDGIDDSVDNFVDVDKDGKDDRTGLTEKQTNDLLNDNDANFTYEGIIPFEQLFDDELLKKYSDRYANLEYDELIELIRRGDPLVMRFVKHDKLKRAVDWLRLRGTLYYLDPEEYMYIDNVIVALMEIERPEVKNQILKAVASGVYNLDPRIRLITFKVLRRLIPDSVMRILVFSAAMSDVEKKLYAHLLNRNYLTREVIPLFKSETVGRPTLINLEGDGGLESLVDDFGNVINYKSLGSQYRIEDLKGKEVYEYAYIELVKLASFIIRRELMSDMVNNPEMMRTIDKDLFKVLSRMIDGEDLHKVPTFNGTPIYINAYAYGMENPDDDVALECGKALVRILRKRSTPTKIREEIFKILRESEFSYLILAPYNGSKKTNGNYWKLLSNKRGVALFMKKNGILPDSNFKWNDRYDINRDELNRIGAEKTRWIWYPLEPEIDWVMPEDIDEDLIEGDFDNEGDFEELGDGTTKILIPDISDGGDITGEGLGEYGEDLPNTDDGGDEGIGGTSGNDIPGGTGKPFDSEYDETELWQLTLKVEPTGAGTIEVITKVKTKNGKYEDGTELQLQAIPNSGYAFDYWKDDLSGNKNPNSILMTSDKTVTAVFGEDADGDGFVDGKWTLTIIIEPAGAGTVKQEMTTPPSTIKEGLVFLEGQYPAGAEVTLTASPLAGYVFDQWQTDLSGKLNPNKIKMDSNKTVTAVFKVDTSGLNLDIFGEPGDFFDIENPTKIRFLNAVQDAPDMELVIDDEKSGPIRFQRITRFHVLPAGEYNVKVIISHNSTLIKDLGKMNLEVYKEYTIVALGFLSGSASGPLDTTIDVMTIKDDLLDLSQSPNRSEFRILHTVPANAAIDIEIVKPDGSKIRPPQMQGLKYRQYSPYIEMQEGVYSINIFIAGTSRTVTTINGFVVERGKRYVLVAMVPLGGLGKLPTW